MYIYFVDLNITLKLIKMKIVQLIMLVMISISANGQNRELSMFFDNGNIKSRYEYTSTQTYSFKNYYQSGKLMETGSFLDGKLDGTWLTFNEAGFKTAEAFYKEGEKIGEWKIFDELGALRYKITYDSKKIVKASNFDSGGHEIAEMQSK
jgi:antitoxin component YwqK of YwqJK toxin-antitoxin module